MFGLSKVEAGAGGIALTEHSEPRAGSGEIRLKVAAAGICGSDMQIYHWAPRMAGKMQLPRILGHEVSGVIDQIGPDVEGSLEAGVDSLSSPWKANFLRHLRPLLPGPRASVREHYLSRHFH